MRQGVRQARERKRHENFERQHTMMERRQRERDEGTSKLEVKRYRVRRWTGFTWRELDKDADKSVREAWEEARKQRESHLDSAAGIVERKLREMRPHMSPRCLSARIDKVPQLMFELTLDATDEDDARKRAMYVIAKGLTAKLPLGFGRKVSLSPPWGRLEVEEQVAVR